VEWQHKTLGGTFERMNLKEAWQHDTESLGLEPCAVKVARTVLRGQRVGNDPKLLDGRNRDYLKKLVNLGGKDIYTRRG